MYTLLDEKSSTTIINRVLNECNSKFLIIFDDAQPMSSSDIKKKGGKRGGRDKKKEKRDISKYNLKRITSRNITFYCVYIKNSNPIPYVDIFCIFLFYLFYNKRVIKIRYDAFLITIFSPPLLLYLM